MKNSMMSKIEEFLVKKSINYDKIDRFMMFRMYEKYKEKFTLKPIIHIIGTNGKGSTGRFLTQLLEALNFKVGHYTSPHIFEFRERFYKNNDIVEQEELENAHERLRIIFREDLEKLSYFEYATFLAVILFEDCDYVIFEAGVGGEYDATSVFDKRMSIFTKIDLDHTQILGDTLEKIARTKLKVMAKQALISNEQDEKVLKIAKKIAFLKNTDLKIAQKLDLKNQELVQAYAKKYQLPDFLKHNLNLALNGLELLQGKDLLKDALQNLGKLKLKGRLEQIKTNLFVDVGHNEMAARALREKFGDEKLVLIFNSFLDKDIFQILNTLKPIIDKIKIYEYFSNERKLANENIFIIAKKLGIKCEKFQHLDPNEKTLVFGSFTLVENFLKEFGDKE